MGLKDAYRADLMMDIKLGSEWIWNDKDGDVDVWVIDVATDERGEILITTEDNGGDIQYDSIDCFLSQYKPKPKMVSNPKITMMSCKDGRLSGKVVLNGHELVVQPFEIASYASPSDKENKLIERAIRSNGDE